MRFQGTVRALDVTWAAHNAPKSQCGQNYVWKVFRQTHSTCGFGPVCFQKMRFQLFLGVDMFLCLAAALVGWNLKHAEGTNMKHVAKKTFGKYFAEQGKQDLGLASSFFATLNQYKKGTQTTGQQASCLNKNAAGHKQQPRVKKCSSLTPS